MQSSSSSSSSSLQSLLSPPNPPTSIKAASPPPRIFFNRVPTRNPRSPTSHVVAKNSQQQEQYEIDPDKAKRALQKLDQQLLQLSSKQASPAKVTDLAARTTREQVKEEVREVPGSVVPYVVVALFAFGVFYNALFLTVIKPAIDGPEVSAGASVRVVMEP